ncbi:BamA/TamA family outer membrane protein, partial [bacterium]|nr:BamA/TamA family outer membrane protein [bacterium]
HRGGWDIYCADVYGEWSQREPGGSRPAPIPLSPPASAGRVGGPPPTRDPDVVGEVREYHPRFSVDMSGALQGGAVFFSPQAGLAMANEIHLSDLLGDHRMSFLVNVYGSFSDSDLAASYAFLKRRIDLGAGLFHYKNYYNTVLTSVGEVLPHDTFFSERNYGLYAFAAYPFSTFRRVSLELQALASEQTSYRLDPTGIYLAEADKRTYRLLQPMLTFVHDSAFYGDYGPVTGGRLLVQFAPSLPVGGNTLSRRTAVFDYRHYWLPWRRNSFALRLMGAGSFGDDARAFVLGGPFTLRGYDFYDYQDISHLAGPKIALMNLEYRLPLLDALIFGWPTRWGFGPIGATLFFDAGAAWTDRFRPFGDDATGRWGMRDLRGAYGIGIRTRLGFIPLKFDWGRRTDLRDAGRTEFHFSIGPEF